MIIIFGLGENNVLGPIYIYIINFGDGFGGGRGAYMVYLTFSVYYSLKLKKCQYHDLS